jgi:hypothetical protein
MKKIIIVLIMTLTMFLFVACGENATKENDTSMDNESTNTTMEELATDSVDDDAETNTTISQNKNIHINDLADLLTDKEEESLKSWVENKYSTMTHNILFLTTNETGGETTKVYSDNYMDEMFPDTDENIAFIIDMHNREIYINTMGTAIQKLSTSDIDSALDAGYQKIINEDYYGCLEEMSKYCLSILTESSENNEDGEDSESSVILEQPLNDYVERSNMQKDEANMTEIKNAFNFSFIDKNMCYEFLKYKVLESNNSDEYDITIRITPDDGTKDTYSFKNITISCNGETDYLRNNEVFYNDLFDMFGNTQSVKLSSEIYQGLDYIITIRFNVNDIDKADKQSCAQISGYFEGFEK